MLSQLLRITTLAKGAIAVSLVAGAYGTAAANTDLPESAYRSHTVSAERTAEPTKRPEDTRKPETVTKPTETHQPVAVTKPEEPKQPTTAPTKECLAAYAKARELKEKDASAEEREAAMRAAREACEHAKPSPKSEPARDVDELVKACLAAYAKAIERREKGNPGEDAEVAAHKAREACERAITASGLSAQDFWAKYRSLFEQLHPVTKPTTTRPTDKPVTTKPSGDVEALVKECARLYAAAIALKDASPETREAAGRKASETCKAAIDASGLTTDQFWAKYRSLFEQLRPVTKPIEKPAPSTVATPTAELDQLVKQCASLYAAAVALKDASPETREAAGRKASEACKAAIAASGLTADAFWAKYRELLAVKR